MSSTSPIVLRFPNRPRPRRRSRPRPLGQERKRGLQPSCCKEVEDENDDEDEDDWGSGGRELRPTIAGTVCIKAIDQSGRHCYNTREHFLQKKRLVSCSPK
jgi:hypothetical protein